MALLSFVGLVSCNKKEEITIPVNNLWFPETACVQEMEIKSNCKWYISIDDDADWYTIEPLSGRQGSISVSVQALGELESRTSSFTITSSKGTVQLQVRVSQNTEEPLEVNSLANKVFGVSHLVRWNVDYYDEVIPESYHRYDYNPYDTTSGYQMYFFKEGRGVQKDNEADSVMYYTFTYEYHPDTRILHLDFEVVGDDPEVYDAPVLIATDELLRFQHEFKFKRWELADLTLIGTIRPDEKSRILQVADKRRNLGGVFQIK